MNGILKWIGPGSSGAASRFLFVLGLSVSLGAAFGAQTDISNAPLSSISSAQVKPNVMLLMDTSGSMGWGHMPDEVESLTGITSIGYKSAQCNVLYYNPKLKYDIPKKPDLTQFAAPSFTAAPYAGFVSYYVAPDATDVTTVNLSTSFRAYDNKTLRTSGSTDVAQPAYYYVHNSGVAKPFGGSPCTDNDGNGSGSSGTFAASDGGTWTRVLVSATSGTGGTDERANFAVWYSFYRIRISLIKSAASLAFTPLSDNFRVGFITVQPKDTPTSSSINASKYVPIADFNTAQRTTWFNNLFSQSPGGASPAREGLARVGRHYAGKQDGINSGMTGDPVQYSCQQNFTIMTTDGYWNAQTETPGGGPVQIDGTTLVGQQDAPLTLASGNAPRPIYDGSSDSTQLITDKDNLFSYANCGTFYNVTTTQTSRSTSQLTASTSQLQQSTSQIMATTSVTSQSTTQTLRSTQQRTQSTAQINQSTSQISRSTSQINRSTTQLQQVNTQLTRSTSQLNVSTAIIRRSTSQLTRGTSQLTQSTLQTRIATSQINRSTSQLRQSTSQLRQSSSQLNVSTSLVRQSTSQITATLTRVSQSTSQTVRCDASTELCAPVAPGTCVAGGLITCQTNTTGPSLVASCTPASATSANNYTTTTCSSAVTGPSGASSCTPSSASAGNGYTTTTCNTVATGPTAVASCTAAAASSSNSYTTTTCATTTTGPTPTATCTAASPTSGNGYVTTTCNTTTTGPTGVQTCTPQTAGSGNSYIAITCNTVTTGPTGAGSCTATAGSAGNSWLTTTCSTVTTGPTPASSCTAATAGSGNSYTATTCNTVTTGPTAVSNCTASAASSGNSWTTTTCPNVTTGPTGVASCTPVSAGGGNSYTATTCNTVTTGPTGAATCTAAGAAAGNSYTATTCNTVTTGPTAVATCTPATAGSGNSYTATTCATTTTGPTPTGTCTAATAAAGNGYTATTCSTVTTGPTNVGTCTPAAASAGNNWTATTCNTVNGAGVGVATCTASGPNGTGAGVICNTVTTGPTPVAACTPSGPTAGNNYTTTTCNTVTTGPTLVAACTAATAAAGNTYTTTTCSTATTGPTPVASCTAAPAAAGNSFTTTTCNTVATGPTGVASCTPVAAAAGNSYTATTCADVISGPTGVSSCTASAPSSGNSYVTTSCTANNTGPTPVATCAAAAAASGNAWTTTTCGTLASAPTPAASCTASGPTSGNGYTTTSCNTVNTAGVGVGTCTPVAASAGNSWTATLCNTVATGPTGVSSCTAAPAAAGNNYTDTTCNPVVSGPTLVASCTPSAAAAGNSWTTTTCNSVSTGPTVAATCTASPANAANGYVATTCVAVPGQKIQYVTTTTTTSTEFSGTSAVSTPVVTVTTGPTTDLNGVCYAPGAQPLLPVPNPQKAGLAAGPTPPCGAWPCTASTSHGGGSVNSLADVAQYYYVTDLRPAMANNLVAVGGGAEDDRATWQHMTTFTIALGVSGTLNYRSDYRSSAATTGDFAAIRTGSKNWPLWPDLTLDYSTGEAWNNPKSIDDYWHTAVNGRGQYFSAGNPTSVIAGLSGALAGIDARVAAGSSAGASSLQPTAGDNFAFVASYTTAKWIGDLQAKPIDLNTGAIGTFHTDPATGELVEDPPIWSAQALLDATTGAACDNRQIYLLRAGAIDNKVNFSWNTRACDAAGAPAGVADTGLNAAEQAFFTGVNITLLGQYPAMTDGTSGTVDQRAPAAGANLVNFLRGQRGNEGFEPNSATKLYRARDHVLGDIVDSQPVYVKGPFADYADAGYSSFKSANAGRTPMVYVGGNDGMLHAFYAGTSVSDPNGGKEAWSIIPSSVLPNLYKLADNYYAKTHQFFVDGTPTVADTYDAGAGGWKTILVGGLNAGGKGYYAVDVTDPASPKGLWEFKWSSTCYDGTPATAGSDCHLGLTFSRPAISKLANGTWVVMFTSGYNNVSAPPALGDGVGYLYVLNASTGKIIHKISTGAGDATTPSGLGQINNFVDNATINNTTLRVYGGDLLGNVWRFDVNDNLAPSGVEATRIGTAMSPNPGSQPQPITVRPELAELNGKPMVFVATGRLLGATDVGNGQVQSIYGIVDPLAGDPAYADLRGSLAPLLMTQVGSGTGAYRTVACSSTATAAQCGSTNGWVVDLPDVGERVNVNMELVLGTLIVGSNVPGGDACSFGGYGWLNFLNFSTGKAVSTSPNASVSTFIDGGLIVGTSTLQLPGNKFQTEVRTSDTKNRATPPPIGPAVPRGNRISWREIVQ